MSDNLVCSHCGVYNELHDYEHMARECWPTQVERLRRQLAQAQERVARETSEIINAVRALPGELQGQGTLADAIRVLVAHNAQLRRVLERVDTLCRENTDSGMTARQLGSEIVGIIDDALADAPDKPENPLAAYTDGQLYDELRRRGWVAATWAREEASP